MPRSVAVIDIGSNSIKVLVATRSPDGHLQAAVMKTLDARISAGISRVEPRLGEEGMQRGLLAVQQLLQAAAPHAPEKVIIVATSAVRDARNGDEFRARIKAATGHDLRVLSGDEEAALIGRGLTVDPVLAGLRNFYVFDLGGGSLECLAFRDRAIQQSRSYQLGCVRLTEQLVPDVDAPFSASSARAVAERIRQAFTTEPFAFDLPEAVAVFAGGSMTTARAILGAAQGRSLEATPSRVTVAELRALLDRLAALPLEARKSVPGLPDSRADVFPAALVTMIELAALARVDAYQHSLYNLRWGLADEALSGR